jgi:hypothetical protein
MELRSETLIINPNNNSIYRRCCKELRHYSGLQREKEQEVDQQRPLHR